MKKLFFLSLLFLMICFSKENKVSAQVEPEHQFFHTNTIKFAPYFIGLNYSGGSIMYETSCGLRFLSLQMRYRYTLNSRELDSTSTKTSHQMIELQSRFWLLQHMKYLYFMPSAALYSKNEWSAGFALGFQYAFAKRIVFDVNGGVYRNNIVEDLEFKFKKQPIFTRFLLGIGYQFSLKKNNQKDINASF